MNLRIRFRLALELNRLEGKREAVATPSPLSQKGLFPLFTGVRLSRTGRPPRDCPNRGGPLTFFDS